MTLPSAPFNTAKSIFAGLTVILLKIRASLTVVTAATDTFTKTAHGFIAGNAFVYVSGTGFTGLTAGNVYYVTSAPSADTFKASATPGGANLTPGTSTAGVISPSIVFESRLLNSKLEQERKYIERPDAQGVLRRVRAVLTKQLESFTFEMDEAKRLLEIFDGNLAGLITGTATLWMPDPADATGFVALKSETDFGVTVTRDGDTKFGDGDFTKPTIMIESTKQGAIDWTADAAT